MAMSPIKRPLTSCSIWQKQGYLYNEEVVDRLSDYIDEDDAAFEGILDLFKNENIELINEDVDEEDEEDIDDEDLTLMRRWMIRSRIWRSI